MTDQLPFKEIEFRQQHHGRVMFFDPKEVFERVKINHFQRHPSVSILSIFPPLEGICSCGCGQILSGRRSRWATDDCMNFATAVRFIIAGDMKTIGRYLRYYYGWNCSKCGCDDKGHDMGANGVVSWIKIDHIIPVKNGGGGWWLSNYQLICHDCHVNKTKEDFGWKGKNKNQLKLL